MLCDSTAKYLHRVALYGIGGVGKTQLAVEYVRRHQTTYTAIFWILATDRTTLLKGFQDIGLSVGCFNTTTGLEPTTAAKLVLSWLRKQKDWLLVFDNLDDITAIHGFLPESTWAGHTIITTRNSNVIGIPAEKLEVPVCDIPDAVELLLTRSELPTPWKDDIKAEAAAIVHELGRLALAIEQAAAYIREAAKDIKKFLPRYRANRKRLLARIPSGNWTYHDSVATTWTLSFQTIKEQNPEVVKLLQLFAFLNPEGIFVDFLVAGSGELDDEVRHIIEDPFTLDEAVFTLEQFSLINRLEDGRIRIHRLIQVVIRDDMSSTEFEHQVEASLKLCEAAFPPLASWSGNPDVLHVCRQFQEQIVPILVLESCTRTELWGRTAGRVGKFLSDDGNYRVAEELLSGAVEVNTRLFGTQNLATLQNMVDLAANYTEQHRGMKATELLKQALEGFRRCLGEEHTETLSTMSLLGVTYWNIGRPKESTELCERAVEECTKSLGDEHPITLTCLSRLAISYWGQSRLDEALTLEERVLDGRRRVFGEGHEETLRAMGNLAITYYSQRKFDKAAELDRETWEGRRRLLGSEHPDTIHSMLNLAWTYSTQGKLAEALELQKSALETSRKVLGEHHPETLAAVGAIGATYRKQGRIEDAAKLFESLLVREERVLGDDDPGTIETMVMLALLCKQLKRLDDAAHYISLAKSSIAKACLRQGKKDASAVPSEESSASGCPKIPNIRTGGGISGDGTLWKEDLVGLIRSVMDINQNQGRLCGAYGLEELIESVCKEPV